MAASLRRGTKEPEPLPLLLLKLQHLLQFIEHELNLRPDDNLAGSLGRADDTGSTGSLDSLLVHLGVILDLKAQTGCAVTNFLHVLLAADSSQNSGSDFGIVCLLYTSDAADE